MFLSLTSSYFFLILIAISPSLLKPCSFIQSPAIFEIYWLSWLLELAKVDTASSNFEPISLGFKYLIPSFINLLIKREYAPRLYFSSFFFMYNAFSLFFLLKQSTYKNILISFFNASKLFSKSSFIVDSGLVSI